MGITYEATECAGSTVVFRARLNHSLHRCPECGHREAVFRGSKTRRLLMGPMGRKRCYLAIQYHRMGCLQCGALRWSRLPFVDGKHRCGGAGHALLRHNSLGCRPLLRWLGVDQNIHRTKLERLNRTIPLDRVNYIGIDEFSIKKGDHCMTIFVDLTNGRILHAVEGKSRQAISPFLHTLKRKAKKLRAIAMDMNGACIWAVREVLPDIAGIFNCYHVMAMTNQTVDEF
ncbi:transposase [Thermodesulforhabdus norvegica]|uniref:transposase n=1 Tax=Thermodesulforhabdus norvegica TaxID=39841 RepID=UPI000B8228A7